MYRTGHVGAALLGSLPLAAALKAAGRPTLGIVATMAVVALCTLPDVDHKIPGLAHRGPTHSFLFALAVGSMVGVAGWQAALTLGLGPPALLAFVGFLAGLLGILTHLLADLITPMGVNVFWPLTTGRVSLGLVYANNVFANQLLFVLGVLGWVILTGHDPGLEPELLWRLAT